MTTTKEWARKQAQDLVSRMTVEEKISQLLYNSPAIERLGIEEYNWWNEASHGLARSGMATVFPHAIGLAATFDTALLQQVGDAVSTEARAKYNNSIAHNDRDIYKGLTFWTPNINIFRDPRWGRGQETFGEDPYLTSALAMSYIDGLQGDGEYLKSAACAKHFAVHSGPEALRHQFNAEVSDKDLWETYLPAFYWSVQDGVAGVMGAYNRTNGYPCCAHPTLMQETLRDSWGFDGYFVSDCWAISDICKFHHYTDTMTEAAALAIQAGCDLNCGDTYHHLLEAYEQDRITEEDITRAAENVFTIRYRLGEFATDRPYADIPFEKLDCAEHRSLNLQAAEESIVLLKNDDYLPLDVHTTQNIAVLGPNAMSVVALEGNYNGMASEYITVADGVRRIFTDANVRVAKGANIWLDKRNECEGFANMISEGIAYAQHADVTILCLGLDCHIEGEETGIHNEYFDNGDKVQLGLPKTQMDLAEAVCDVCDNVIVVVLAGSAVTLSEKLTRHAKAILHGWYPGAVGGLAIARLLGGLCSPSGRLPVTFYRQIEDIPAFTDYRMEGRTYRYFHGEPLYPFGYGLSYTHFQYASPKVTAETEDTLTLTVSLTNVGKMEGIEKVQVYSRFTDSRTSTPICQLCSVRAVHLTPGEETTVTLTIQKYWLKAVLSDGTRVTPDGEVTLIIGGHQPDARSTALCADTCVTLAL